MHGVPRTSYFSGVDVPIAEADRLLYRTSCLASGIARFNLTEGYPPGAMSAPISFPRAARCCRA
jgi:hypothetical protein